VKAGEELGEVGAVEGPFEGSGGLLVVVLKGEQMVLLGTPAEEVCNAAGKILMLERGAF